MKLSIVMTYRNRARQLLNTLWSIENTFRGFPIEVIIVDDCSTEKIPDVRGFSFYIKKIILKEKRPYDIITAHNIGFSAVTGDVILINCAECLHVGNIIAEISYCFQDDFYMPFATYSIGKDKFEEIEAGRNVSNILDIISPTHPLPMGWKDGDTGWYSHPEYNDTVIPFCAAISTGNMDKLQGYDERFSEGTGWADLDFIDRVKNLGLRIVTPEYPFCVHQWHTPTDYSGPLNNELFLNLRKDEPSRIQCPGNKYYKR